MKKLFAITACLFAAVALFAQPQEPQRQKMDPKQREEQRKKDFERLQSEKIAFITQEIDLTPEEAQVFWPVYNQCGKEAREAHKAQMEAMGEIRGKKAEGLSDSELEKKLDAYIKASKEAAQVMADWYPKFKKVLPISKVAKLYQAEEAFQMRMINNLKKHPQPQPQQPQAKKEKK